MTSKEAKVYLSKQIAMCEEKIELYEKVKTSKDFIELHKNLLDFYKTIEKSLDLLDLYKKFFKYSLTEIQGIKYLVLPNSDIRRPDSMLKITDGEYELLKEGLERC